jgi:hypothetical protein
MTHVCGNYQNINMSGVRSNNMERTWLIVSFEHETPVLAKEVADRAPQFAVSFGYENC